MDWLHGTAPEAHLIEDERRSWNQAELSLWADQFSAGASAAGLAPGDRFAVLAKNRGEYVAAYLAAMRSGLVLVPLNWRLHPEELLWQIQDSGASMVISDLEHAPQLDQIAAADVVEHWWFLADAGPRTGCSNKPWQAIESRLTMPLETVAAEPEQPFVQMYTSGTTGRPKGALLTPNNYQALADSWLREMPLGAGHRVLQVTPLFHVGALLMTLLALRAEATLVLLPMFEPDRVLEALRTRFISHTLLVPAMMEWLLKDPQVEKQPIQGLEALIYGASPISVELLPRAMKFFGCDFYQGYGLTETSGVSTTLRPEDHRQAILEMEEEDSAARKRLASAGRPIDCCEVSIVDGDDRPLSVGEVGEIVTRGANVMLAYDGRPEETAQAMRHGWFHTGDAGFLDDEGYLFLVDRIKDMVIVGGENVYPSEVERVLRTQPEVVEAAVIGVPHKVWGEAVVGYVVTHEQPPEDGLSSQLIRACRGQLARYKAPTKIVFVDELPRNAVGKVAKNELQSRWREGRERKI